MRTDPSAFAALNGAAVKSPRFVVKVEFSASALYLSSHDDIDGVPATHLEACLVEPSISSQKLNPDEGRAEIGAASFVIADRSSAFTIAARSRLAAGEGLRGKTVRFYLGYAGLDFGDFQPVGTQVIKEAAFDRGSYRIACNDIQRAARKDIFDLATTTIAATVEADATTIEVVSTAGFETCKHGTSYSDAASSTVGYIKIKDEVIRYTGKTATSFTGCTRGVLGTEAARYVADGATPTSRREKVTEYVYLELPGPKLVYAILTGTLYGDSATLPSSWHLGISPSLIRLADFTGIGKDLWDTSSDAAGVVVRFEGITKTDGKAFVELELLRLLGLYMPVYADGTLGLRRMTRVISDAATVATLDETNSVTVGDLEHDMESLHNAFSVLWNWNGKEYTRTTTFLDATSVATHGRAPTMELKFKGLYGGRHTDGLIFKLLDSIRDRYSAPPVRLKVDVLHSLNTIEVGDVVRVRHACLRDFAGIDETIDRAFEVQSVSVNHRTGAVSLDLFGSTATAVASAPTSATTALPDGFYTASGTNLTSAMTISSGVVSGGPYTLAGGTDLTAAGSIWYYDGDLTIPAGVTVNITGNVQLRVKGYLTINGTINGVGGGLSGVADNTSATVILSGNPGFVGNSRGLDGCAVDKVNFDRVIYATTEPALTAAKHASFPFIQLKVSGSTLKGLPSDLRGTGGAPGGKVTHSVAGFWKAGGTGAAGGAGLCTISRGLGLGASATINLSGANAAAPSSYVQNESEGFKTRSIDFFPGAGGAGGPGAYLLLIDGGLLSVPDLAGRFTAKCGLVESPAATTVLSSQSAEKFKSKYEPFGGFLANPAVISGLDLSFSAHRIQYIPAPETATEDTLALSPPSDLSISSNSSGYVVSFSPPIGAPAGTVYEVWEHTAATPFSSAVKRVEGAATGFFLSRPNTSTVYVWVRAKFRAAKQWIYSATTPASSGQPAAAAATAGTYATATPSSVSATAANTTVTTPSVTAGLVGATPTTYSWARISGSTSISANSASSATTTFTATGVTLGSTLSAVFRCTINGSYTVDVAVDCTNTGAALAITATPTATAKTQDASTVTTDGVTAAASGGAGGYGYAWTKVSGGSISAVSPSSATTTFQATGLTANETRAATFRCTVTDGASATATVDVSVTITRAAFGVTLSTYSIYREGSLSKIKTGGVSATPVGGTSPYTYAWSYVSGDTTITADTPTEQSTTFTALGMVINESRSAVFRCTVTEAGAAVATADVTVSFYRTTF